MATPKTPAAADGAVKLKRVVIQRPRDNKDVGVFLGFNDVSGVYPFETPIFLPEDMVTFWRSQKEVQHTPGPNGEPVPSYTNMFVITDAPEAPATAE